MAARQDVRELYPDKRIVLEHDGVEHELPDEDEAELSPDLKVVRLSSAQTSSAYDLTVDPYRDRVVLRVGTLRGTTPRRQVAEEESLPDSFEVRRRLGH